MELHQFLGRGYGLGMFPGSDHGLGLKAVVLIQQMEVVGILWIRGEGRSMVKHGFFAKWLGFRFSSFVEDRS